MGGDTQAVGKPIYQSSPSFNPSDYTNIGATQPRGAFLPIEESEQDYWNNIIADLMRRFQSRSEVGVLPEGQPPSF